jgi:DNA-binding CsgD family transcriptional regulator
VIGNLAALGVVELSVGNAEAACDALLRAWDTAHRGGVASPARFPVLADAVEALVAHDEVDRAARLAGEHGEISRRLGRPWALALAARCEALVAGARGEEREANGAFERALSQHERQLRPLDRARTLLAFGRFQRRRRRKSNARELLEQSAAIFETAEAARWAEVARAELGRIGGRRVPARQGLSVSESAIAELVGVGMTNREVAAALHLSARTVEWNLSKVYRKLGVRSRTELARALADREHAPRTLEPVPSLRKSGDIPG